MENQPNWALLARYVAGECSPEEEREVDAWLRADPSRNQLLDQVRRIWDAAAEPPLENSAPQLDVDAEWDDLQAKMQTSDRAASNGRSREKRPRARSRRRAARSRRLTWSVRGAAGLLLLVGGLWLAQSVWTSTPADEAETAHREVVTEPGERSQVQLADGSSVMLNVDSELRLPKSFHREKRVVELTGEAYFEVETDPDRPFIVETEDASVEVHGTAFNLQDYPDADQIHVAVKEGGVSVRPKQANETREGARLQSGEVGSLTRQEDASVTTKMDDVSAYLGWTEGRLVFEDTPLSTVAVRLERWYDVEVHVRDASLESRRLTASLKSQSLEHVLNVITASLDIQYRIDQNTVLLTSPDRSPE